MSILQNASARQLNAGLAILRIVLGAIFIAHGAQKLFVFGMPGVAGAFGQMCVPMAGVVGPFIAMLEFFGGIALVLGLLTRFAALGLSFTMIGAILIVHLPAGFFLPNGYEFTLALLAMAVFVTIAGAGAYSVDGLIARRGAGDDLIPAGATPVRTSRAA